MARESLQKKLSRERPPRVHITYDVHTDGAIEKREIPFVVGVLADLSGQPEQPLLPMKDRKFVEIDKDKLDTVLAKANPRLVFNVNNVLRPEAKSLLGVELRFRSMADFEPAAVARQIPALRKLLEKRQALHNLRTSLMGNDQLEAVIQQTLNDSKAMRQIEAESKTQPAEAAKKEEA